MISAGSKSTLRQTKAQDEPRVRITEFENHLLKIPAGTWESRSSSLLQPVQALFPADVSKASDNKQGIDNDRK